MKKKKIRIKAENYSYLNCWIWIRLIWWALMYFGIFMPQILENWTIKENLMWKAIMFMFWLAVWWLWHRKLSWVIETHKDEYYK